MPAAVRKIYIGVAGWSYPDWAGYVYPARRKRGFSELAYLARYIDAMELNVTFYRPPTASLAEGWLRQVEGRADFLFTAKLWQRFTHERAAPWTAAEARGFRAGLKPLREAGRLGAVLAQFPWSFRAGEQEFDWLAKLSDEFGEDPLAVEVRHESWNSDEAREFLRGKRLNFCNIDQPRLRANLPATNVVTGPVAYYRFHGRNAAAWFDSGAGRDRRYDYLYSTEELTPWVAGMRETADRVQKMFVMTNNHYRGQELVNALQMKAMLSRERVPVPDPLLDAYPVLKDIAAPVVAQKGLEF